MSFGKGAYNLNDFFVAGCMNFTLAEWRACRLILFDILPYSVSPISGVPAA
jgi:hypothetical protein